MVQNILGDEENADHKYFFHFPSCFPKLNSINIAMICKGLTLPNDKILDQPKFKAIADNKIILTQKSKFELGTIESIVGKGENAGYQHFLLFPQRFQKLSFPEVLKVRIVW